MRPLVQAPGALAARDIRLGALEWTLLTATHLHTAVWVVTVRLEQAVRQVEAVARPAVPQRARSMVTVQVGVEAAGPTLQLLVSAELDLPARQAYLLWSGDANGYLCGCE